MLCVVLYGIVTTSRRKEDKTKQKVMCANYKSINWTRPRLLEMDKKQKRKNNKKKKQILYSYRD